MHAVELPARHASTPGIIHSWHDSLQELHGSGNIPGDYRNRDEPAFMEASRWLQRCAKLFNKDRLTENRYRLIRDVLGAACLHCLLFALVLGDFESLDLAEHHALDAPICRGCACYQLGQRRGNENHAASPARGPPVLSRLC